MKYQKERVVRLWKQVSPRNKPEFIFGLIFSYLRGEDKFDNDLSLWEETIEIQNNPQLMERIKFVRERMARNN